MAGVYDVNVEGDGDMYNKGMLFLNTLRHVINDDELWFDLLRDMTTKEFAYKTITANDVMFYFNRKTGMNLTPLFMQYVFYKDIPNLYYQFEKIKGKSYVFKYKWMTDVGSFEMPIEISWGDELMRLNGTNDLQEIVLKKKKKANFSINEEQFYIKTRKR